MSAMKSSGTSNLLSSESVQVRDIRPPQNLFEASNDGLSQSEDTPTNASLQLSFGVSNSDLNATSPEFEHVGFATVSDSPLHSHGPSFPSGSAVVESLNSSNSLLSSRSSISEISARPESEDEENLVDYDEEVTEPRTITTLTPVRLGPDLIPPGQALQSDLSQTVTLVPGPLQSDLSQIVTLVPGSLPGDDAYTSVMPLRGAALGHDPVSASEVLHLSSYHPRAPKAPIEPLTNAPVVHLAGLKHPKFPPSGVEYESVLLQAGSAVNAHVRPTLGKQAASEDVLLDDAAKVSARPMTPPRFSSLSSSDVPDAGLTGCTEVETPSKYLNKVLTTKPSASSKKPLPSISTLAGMGCLGKPISTTFDSAAVRLQMQSTLGLSDSPTHLKGDQSTQQDNENLKNETKTPPPEPQPLDLLTPTKDEDFKTVQLLTPITSSSVLANAESIPLLTCTEALPAFASTGSIRVFNNAEPVPAAFCSSTSSFPDLITSPSKVMDLMSSSGEGKMSGPEGVVICVPAVRGGGGEEGHTLLAAAPSVNSTVDMAGLSLLQGTVSLAVTVTSDSTVAPPVTNTKTTRRGNVAGKPKKARNSRPTVAVTSVVSSLSDTILPHERPHRGGWPKGKKRKKPVAQTPPTAPKPAFTYFLQENRAEVAERYPSHSYPQMVKVLSYMWGALTSAEKQPYMAKFEEGKQKYFRELQEYQKTDSYVTFLKTKRARKADGGEKEDDLLNGDLDDALPYCKLCNVTFINNFNKGIHMTSKQHRKAITEEYEEQQRAELMEQEEKAKGLGAMNPLDRTAFAHLEADAFTTLFLEKNAERERELRTLRETVIKLKGENAAVSTRLQQAQIQRDRLNNLVSVHSQLGVTLKYQLEHVQVLPSLFASDNSMDEGFS